MALTLNVKTDKAMDLSEFIDYVERDVDVTDQDAIVEAAPALLALANNQRLIIDRLNDDLKNWRDFQTTNSYTAQTLVLGRGDGFIVRANIWTPYDGSEQSHEWQQKLFLYTVAHDHNFDLLTVGYHGPGYETDLYEYDRSSVLGLPGEPVDLVARGRTTLDHGKVMFYRASRDVHAQYPPKAFSISINLMGSDSEMSLREQFYFDVERRCIRAPVETGISNRVLLCEAARYFGDARTSSLLERIADVHPCGRTRTTALESLAFLEPGSGERLWARAADDGSAYVREVARRKLKLAEAAGGDASVAQTAAPSTESSSEHTYSGDTSATW